MKKLESVIEKTADAPVPETTAEASEEKPTEILETSEAPQAVPAAPKISAEDAYINLNFNILRKSLYKNLEYPEKAKKMGITGKGIMMLEIDESGKITDVSLAEEFGNKLLNEAALKAARQIRKANAPGIKVQIKIPIIFSLK